MAGVLGAPNPSTPGVQGVLAAPTPVPAFGSNAPGQPPTQQPFSLRQPYFAGQPQPDFAAQPPASGQLPNQAPGPDAPIPAPTHAQALAALRHFDAIESAIAEVARDPALGKSSVKTQIVDAVANLVANRIMSAPQAVEELGNVPERPFDQKTWLAQQLMTTIQARSEIYSAYARTHPGSAQDQTYDADNHIADVEGLTAQYRAYTEHMKKKGGAHVR